MLELLNCKGKKLPWGRNFKVDITENNHGLLLLILFDTPAMALLSAGSFLQQINKYAAEVNRDIKQIIITSKSANILGHTYAPTVTWKVNYKDRRNKKLNKVHLNAYFSFLWQLIILYGLLRNPNSMQKKLLFDIFRGESPQDKAIYSQLEHLYNMNFMSCDVAYAMDQINKSKHLLEQEFAFNGYVTRLQALIICHYLHLINLKTRRHSSLRPPMESIIPVDAIKLIEQSFLLQPGRLCGPDRDILSAYARHLAMTVLHNTTSRSLQQIGISLGRSDHTTVMHGLRKINRLSDNWEVQRYMINIYNQVADNIGIYYRYGGRN